VTYEETIFDCELIFLPYCCRKMSTSNTHCNRRLPFTRGSSRRQSATPVAPEPTPVVCPELKKIKKAQERVAQKAAFDELLVLRSANGGKNRHGDMQNIVNKYSGMGFLVNRSHIEYLFELQRKAAAAAAAGESAPTEEVTTNLASGETAVSDLTKNTDDTNNLLSTSTTNSSNDEDAVPESASEAKRKGGRPTGSTISEIRNKEKLLSDALTKAATLCIDARNAAKIANKILTDGTFKKLIKETEEEYNLDADSINYNTIRSRVQSNNASGARHQHTSPLWEVEDLIVDTCVRLARMGESLTKYEVMDLADEIIADTESEDRLIEYCKKRQIYKDLSSGKIVGERWYSNFINRHKEKLKRGRCKIQDVNRLTWCTTEHFQNMYDAVYEEMVNAKVAIKFEEE
jgi:hypothetical protein